MSIPAGCGSKDLLPLSQETEAGGLSTAGATQIKTKTQHLAQAGLTADTCLPHWPL